MRTDRRLLILSVPALLSFPRWALAAEDQGLFWRVQTRDQRSGILFGYGRVAASRGPDIVRDGIRMVEQAPRVVLDMNPFTLPPTTVRDLPPLLPRLSPAVAAELRLLLTRAGLPQQQLEKLPGFVIAMVLGGEGQANANPSVGDVIVDRARQLRRPLTFLFTEDETRQMAKPVDMAALNDSAGEETITFLLDLRKRVGPVGAYAEQLYRDRKSEELYRFSKALADHGGGDPGAFFKYDPDLFFSRVSGALTAQEPGFFLLPVGLLTGPDGFLERFRHEGADVRVLA